MKKILSKIFNFYPSDFIISGFGTGFLPVWQNHWAGFCSLLMFHIFVIFTIGYNVEILEFIIILFQLIIYLGLFYIISFSIQFIKGTSLTHDNIVVSNFFGNICLMFFATPMFFILKQWLEIFYTNICEDFITCAIWFHTTMVYLTVYSIFYFIYRVIDVWKIWPISFLERDYHNGPSYLMQGVISALYSSFILYFIGFIFFQLNIFATLNLYKVGIYNGILDFYTVYYKYKIS